MPIIKIVEALCLEERSGKVGRRVWGKGGGVGGGGEIHVSYPKKGFKSSRLLLK